MSDSDGATEDDDCYWLVLGHFEENSLSKWTRIFIFEDIFEIFGVVKRKWVGLKGVAQCVVESFEVGEQREATKI